MSELQENVNSQENNERVAVESNIPKSMEQFIDNQEDPNVR